MAKSLRRVETAAAVIAAKTDACEACSGSMAAAATAAAVMAARAVL
jgi:hypothetical protein